MSDVPLNPLFHVQVVTWAVPAVSPAAATEAFQKLDAALSRQGRFKNNCFAEICSGSEEGSYVRLINFGITRF